MSETVISVENISKQYRLGLTGTGTLSHDLKRWWHTVRGKEDPYLKIGETNDRTNKGASEYVWSLKNINFDVQQGDVMGIIGRNGAGKSTLLKILSKVTHATTGQIKVKGRIASLLEVGTGFHPDLTGRENVFLNGAILGMTKKEIKAKLDEIVDFSGVERYIDTPVKRYSSGMYVRLAFAVAAQLESEILIVDEVLAVGDTEFQKKCLGKMKDVAGNGRTVLFVSHNMGSIVQLCNKGVLLHNGQLKTTGDILTVVDEYSSIEGKESTYTRGPEKTPSEVMYIEEIYLTDEGDDLKSDFGIDEFIKVFVRFKVNKLTPHSQISLTIQSKFGEYLTTIIENVSDIIKQDSDNDSYLISFKLQNNVIAPNSYFLRVALFVLHKDVYDLVEMVCPFKVFDSGSKLARLEGINYGNYILNYETL